MSTNKFAIGFGAMALVIAGSALTASAAHSEVPLPITGAETVVTGAHFNTAAGLARPFAGALAANRLAASPHWAYAAQLPTTGSAELPAGVTARAVLQSLAAQGNEVASALPAAWR